MATRHVVSVNGETADPNTGDVDVVIKRRKVIILNATILGINDTYPLLIAAPGVGKMLSFRHADLVLKMGEEGYTNVNTFDMAVVYGAGWNADASAYIKGGFLNGTNVVNKVHLLPSQAVDENFGLIAKIADPIELTENMGLYLAYASPDGNPVGGAGSSLEVTLEYSIVDL